MAVLDGTTITERLAKLNGWERDGEAITKTYTWKDFAESLTFVNQVGGLAEERNHHPDIDIRWNKVKLSLSTHSEGGLTAADFDLAEAIEALAG
jgi:4a-hydroxytetrahydrobiopterin dehydratase